MIPIELTVDPRMSDGICHIKRRVRLSSIIWSGLGPQEMDMDIWLRTYDIKREKLAEKAHEYHVAQGGHKTSWPMEFTWRFIA